MESIIQEDTPNKKLEGLNVLVIGDTGMKTIYREVVRNHGGKFSFVDGIDESRRVPSKAGRADVVFYITSYAKHKTTASLSGLDNIILVNKESKSELERKIQEYRQK